MAYKIQQLGLGGVLDQAIAITKDHFGLLFSIMLLLLVPATLIMGAVWLAIMPALPPQPTLEDYVRVQEAMRDYWPLLTGLYVLNLVVVLPLTNAAVTYAISRLYLSQPVTALESVRFAVRRFVPLVLTGLLMFVIIGIGFLLLIIPGIYFSIWFGLGQYVVVIEETSGMQALRRSKQLVHPQRGTFLALLIVTGLLTAAISWIGNLIPQPHLALIVSTLIQAVTTILWTSAGVVFYFSCRSALENFDLHYLAESIGEDAPANPSAAARPLG